VRCLQGRRRHAAIERWHAEKGVKSVPKRHAFEFAHQNVRASAFRTRHRKARIVQHAGKQHEHTGCHCCIVTNSAPRSSCEGSSVSNQVLHFFGIIFILVPKSIQRGRAVKGLMHLLSTRGNRRNLRRLRGGLHISGCDARR
jgi:hypothetical protein